jgi:tungstate transport system ATP-binding protein
MFPIHLDQLRYVPDGREVLAGVDLRLDGEGITVVLGPNGAGKSVLIRLLAGLEQPHAGSIVWNGGTEPAEPVAIVFQHPILLRSTVAANAALGLKPLHLTGDQVRDRVAQMLTRVGLVHRAADSARHLSGGERQRLALARAWAIKPRLLLLDEPTAALDPSATEAVEKIIREIRTDGAKIVMTTQNLGQAMRLADDVVMLDRGLVREHTPSARFFSRPQSNEARLFMQGELNGRLPPRER